MHSDRLNVRPDTHGRFLSTAAIISLLGFSTSVGTMVLAQEQDEPASVQVGPGYLTPSIEVRVQHNDNLLLQPVNEISTTSNRTLGNLNYEIGTESRMFIVNWLVDTAQYHESSDDNYVDNTLSARFQFAPTSRFYSDLRATARDMHDFRGTGRAESDFSPISEEPDEWRSVALESSIGYGAYESTGRVEFDVGRTAKEYRNNREFTYLRDRDDTYAAGRFFYRVGPRTRLLVEARTAMFEYDQDPLGAPTLDSRTDRLYVGATWDPTAALSGAVRVGNIRKDFDSSLREDTSSMAWEAEIDYAVRTYSTLSLFTARDFTETNGTGDFIQHETVGVTWNHSWADRFSTDIGLQYAMDKFDPTTREDDIAEASIGLNYQMRRWLTLGANYRHSERDSNDNRFDFDRNIFELSIRMVL